MVAKPLGLVHVNESWCVLVRCEACERPVTLAPSALCCPICGIEIELELPRLPVRTGAHPAPPSAAPAT